MSLQKLLEILISNGLSPVYDEVLRDTALTLLFLFVTVCIECGAFYLYFRNKQVQSMGDHILAIFMLNLATFVIGYFLWIIRIS